MLQPCKTWTRILDMRIQLSLSFLGLAVLTICTVFEHFGITHYTVKDFFSFHPSIASTEKEKVYLWEIWISLFKLFPFACKGAFEGCHQLSVCWAPLRWGGGKGNLSAAGQGLRPFPRRSKICLWKSCPEDRLWVPLGLGGPPLTLRKLYNVSLLHSISHKHTCMWKNGREAEAREIVACIHIFEGLRWDLISLKASPMWDVTEVSQRLEILFLH